MDDLGETTDELVSHLPRANPRTQRPELSGGTSGPPAHRSSNSRRGRHGATTPSARILGSARRPASEASPQNQQQLDEHTVQGVDPETVDAASFVTSLVDQDDRMRSRRMEAGGHRGSVREGPLTVGLRQHQQYVARTMGASSSRADPPAAFEQSSSTPYPQGERPMFPPQERPVVSSRTLDVPTVSKRRRSRSSSSNGRPSTQRPRTSVAKPSRGNESNSRRPGIFAPPDPRPLTTPSASHTARTTLPSENMGPPLGLSNAQKPRPLPRTHPRPGLAQAVNPIVRSGLPAANVGMRGHQQSTDRPIISPGAEGFRNGSSALHQKSRLGNASFRPLRNEYITAEQRAMILMAQEQQSVQNEQATRDSERRVEETRAAEARQAELEKQRIKREREKEYRRQQAAPPRRALVPPNGSQNQTIRVPHQPSSSTNPPGTHPRRSSTNDSPGPPASHKESHYRCELPADPQAPFQHDQDPFGSLRRLIGSLFPPTCASASHGLVESRYCPRSKCRGPCQSWERKNHCDSGYRRAHYTTVGQYSDLSEQPQRILDGDSWSLFSDPHSSITPYYSSSPQPPPGNLHRPSWHISPIRQTERYSTLGLHFELKLRSNLHVRDDRYPTYANLRPFFLCDEHRERAFLPTRRYCYQYRRLNRRRQMLFIALLILLLLLATLRLVRDSPCSSVLHTVAVAGVLAVLVVVLFNL